jgi:phage-related protein
VPATEVCFYREINGDIPVRDWLADLMKRDRTAFSKCAAAIHRLAAFGYELRRPQVDMLRDGIYELRVKKGHVNYRILYFFHGRNVVVLANALTKERTVPDIEIERAISRRHAYQQDPTAHRATEEFRDA